MLHNCLGLTLVNKNSNDSSVHSNTQLKLDHIYNAIKWQMYMFWHNKIYWKYANKLQEFTYIEENILKFYPVITFSWSPKFSFNDCLLLGVYFCVWEFVELICLFILGSTLPALTAEVPRYIELWARQAHWRLSGDMTLILESRVEHNTCKSHTPLCFSQMAVRSLGEIE